MSALFGERPRFAPSDVALYAIGVAGLTMCLTLVFLAMRAVIDVGGFCAEGGPYVIDVHCPEGVPLVLTGGIFGLFGFGGLMAWKGSVIGGPYGGPFLLAWPALFLSLGWNFLEYALRPPQGEGIAFVLMGGVPLLAALPIGNSGRAGDARARLASGLAPRPRPSPALDAERAAMATVMTDLFGRKSADAVGGGAADLVSRLERLAALRQSGDLTADEYEQAKRALLGGAVT